MNFKLIDFYFMTGLPGQTTDRKLGRFFHRLHEVADGKADAFVAP